jgi:DNA-3-methyladenine glycosylase II
MAQKTSLLNSIEALKKTDPVLSQIIHRIGPVKLTLQRDYFYVLVKSIVWQQLSGKSAKAIFDRLQGLYDDGTLEPEDILGTSDETLRSIGLSRQKLSYLKDLSLKVHDGTLALKKVPRMPDEEVIQYLIQVRGIGRWTAEMFLIFSLGRLDVLPVDDLGLRKGVQKAYQLEELPKGDGIKKLAEPWRPHRTAATLYLWRNLEGPEGGQL